MPVGGFKGVGLSVQLRKTSVKKSSQAAADLFTDGLLSAFLNTSVRHVLNVGYYRLA